VDNCSKQTTQKENSQEQKLLRAYHAIGDELISLTSLPELLNKILEISKNVFQFENAIMRLVSDDGTELVLAASYGYPDPALKRKLQMGEGIMGRVAASAAPVLIDNVTQDHDYIPGIPDARSALCVPLVARDRVIGVFNVESHQESSFHSGDVAPLMTMAAQAAIAIENARLYERTSQLTERFRQLHQFNDRILQSTTLGIYTLDANLCITSWNKRMEKASGMTENQVLGRPLLTLFPVLAEEGFDDRLNRVLKTGKPEKLQLIHYNLQGQRRVQKRRLSPLKDGDVTTGVVIVVEDITEFKGLLDQMIQSEKLAEIGRLSSGVAHEINNPLEVISYSAQLLLREESLSDFHQELLTRIGSEVERLQALTSGLLGFSRSGSMKKSRIDVNEVLEQVLTFIGYQIQRGQHEVVRNFGEVPAIMADPNQLKQVYINLIMNAVQAMKTPGIITLTTRALAYGVEIDIADTGDGVEEELRDKIFEPFYTTKPEGEGTGLGLYLCRKIMSDHEGSLNFESTRGEGSRFILRLPLRTR